MSLLYEQRRALILARELLSGLATGRVKRVPKAVRDDARCALRHFPFLADSGEPMFSGDAHLPPTHHFVHLPAIDEERALVDGEEITVDSVLKIG